MSDQLYKETMMNDMIVREEGDVITLTLNRNIVEDLYDLLGNQDGDTPSGRRLSRLWGTLQVAGFTS